MERLCFLMHLHEGREAEYEQRHADLWPDMQAALLDAGFTNYSLFRRGTLVVAYAECVPDAATVLATIGDSEVNRRWGESFVDIIESMTDNSGELLTAREVWHLASSDAPAPQLRSSDRGSRSP